MAAGAWTWSDYGVHGHPAGRGRMGRLGVGAAGLILLGISADPSAARVLPPGWRWILVALAVPVAMIAWYVKRRSRSWGGSRAGIRCQRGILRCSPARSTAASITSPVLWFDGVRGHVVGPLVVGGRVLFPNAVGGRGVGAGETTIPAGSPAHGSARRQQGVRGDRAAVPE